MIYKVLCVKSSVLYYIILLSVLWMFTFNFKFCILYSSWGFLLCRMICIKISPQSSISRILQSLLFYLDGVIRGRSIQWGVVYILFMFNWAFVHFRIVLISVELIWALVHIWVVFILVEIIGALIQVSIVFILVEVIGVLVQFDTVFINCCHQCHGVC